MLTSCNAETFGQL